MTPGAPLLFRAPAVLEGLGFRDLGILDSGFRVLVSGAFQGFRIWGFKIYRDYLSLPNPTFL